MLFIRSTYRKARVEACLSISMKFGMKGLKIIRSFLDLATRNCGSIEIMSPLIWVRNMHGLSLIEGSTPSKNFA